MDVQPTYYVTFTAYDPETNTEVSTTIEPSPGGVLRFQPELRDIWASIDQKLQQELRTSVFERFNDKWEVDINGCYIWTGRTKNNGYGQFYWNGRYWQAHRAAFALFVGEIQQGLVIDHLCRNRACVNPDHLEAVTQQENIRRGQTGKNSINNFQRRKTHCPGNHEYSVENTRINKRGERICRACANEKNRQWRKTKKE